MSATQTGEITFFDPFLNEEFSFEQIQQSLAAAEVKYQNNEIEHDYGADQFVADAEALFNDAAFVYGWETAKMFISSRMHELCGEDHNLASAMAASETFRASLDSHEGHNHLTNDEHKKEENKKKQSKSTKYRNFLSFLLSKA